MGTLGKVLLAVNLLAAAGLTYFAAQDLTRRREVNAVALQHHIALKGLPVEGAATDDSTVPFALDLTGGAGVTAVRKSLLETYFKDGSGGSNFGDPAPAVSQLAELNRVKAKVKTVVASQDGPAAKLAYLAGSLGQERNTGRPTFTPGLLARLATSYVERAAITELAVSGSPDAVDKAEAALDQRFAAAEKVDTALATADGTALKDATEAVKAAAADVKAQFDRYQANPSDQSAIAGYDVAREKLVAATAAQSELLLKVGSGTASRDAADQRRRIARILIEVDPADAWQRRTALVVGLRAYKEAVGEQVDRLRDLIAAVEARKVADQAEFIEAYQLLREQAVAATGTLDQQKRLTADLVAQRGREKEQADQRRKQYQARQMELASVKAEVADLLAKQTAVEAELFAVERRVGDALRLNVELEKQVQDAETKRSGR
jgi:hypothetical protein